MEKEQMTLLWARVKQKLSEKYVPSIMNLFFEKTELFYFDGTNAVVTHPDAVIANSLTKYKDTVEEFFEEIHSSKIEVIFASTEQGVINLPDFISDVKPDYEPTPKSEKTTYEEKNDNDEKEYFFDSRYTFDNFIVGSSNTFAHAACQAVARDGVNSGYNPLFIYGGSGLGKTHLLYAIINETLRLRPDTNIVYVKSEDFTNEIINAIHNATTAQFRDKYRKADMLLIDDVQFIAGKESTQEEFFHTFNALYDDRKQIVLTSDRPARDINQLTERMKNRFEWGLMADVQAPDYELRIAIMQDKAKSHPVVFPQEVFKFLADHLKTNIRQMEGAINKIAAMARLQNIPVTVDLAAKCISDIISSNEPDTVVVSRIISAVSQKYGISEEDIRSKKRIASIVSARNVAMYIARKITDMSLDNIGKEFNRNHTTAMACIGNVEKDLKTQPFLEIEIEEIIKEIKE